MHIYHWWVYIFEFKQNMSMFIATMVEPPPIWHGSFMPMGLIQTLLWIHHAYALENPKPWIIEHWIQIFNMLVFSHWLHYVAHLHFLWMFRNRYGFFYRFQICKFEQEYIIFFYFFLIYLLSSLLNSKNTLLVFCPYLLRFSTI